MRLTLLCLASLVAATGCLSLSDSTSRVEGDEGEGGEIDQDGCKIEGDQIGTEGTILRLGSRTVTFHDWVTKTGEASEFVGFSITVEGASSVSYVVKTGGETYPSSEGSWMHPEGPDGADKAPAISNVDFCGECTDGGCDDGGGDDGGGGDGSGSGDPILL